MEPEGSLPCSQGRRKLEQNLNMKIINKYFKNMAKLNIWEGKLKVKVVPLL
jgi:hypothetical protein